MKTKLLLKAKKFFVETFCDGNFPTKEEIAQKMEESSFVPKNSKIIFTTYYTQEVLERQHMKLLEPFGINNANLEILKILYFAKKSTMTQESIGKVMFISKANVSTQLSKLENQNLISRIENKNNKRQKIVNITKKGEEKLYQIAEKMNPWKWENLLEENEIEEYIRLNKKIRANIEVLK